MSSVVFRLSEIDKSSINIVGGKGANLGELGRIKGIRVPDGFCISTEAYTRILAEVPAINSLLDQLSEVAAADRHRIAGISADIRAALENAAIPLDIREEITQGLSSFGEPGPYAVRSSATAEDLPTASFAGQQDTYLNIIGKEEIMKHISKCWASLFTDRAVTYRIQNGFDHRKVKLAVVVQRMLSPDASGTMFTADPLTGHRKVLSVDAGFGLGEALVSGLVNPDNYKVREGKIVNKKLATKKVVIQPLQDGGTGVQEVAPGQQNMQVLTDDQIVELGQIGRAIEAHFSHPQDIEWCLQDDVFYIVQSRPITSLFPIPGPQDCGNRVYVSVGHQQMMTDPIKPLGLSFYLLITRAPMYTAGGRLFVDVTDMLASPAGRQQVMNTLGKSEALINDALTNVIERGDFIEESSAGMKEQVVATRAEREVPSDPGEQPETDPTIVSHLIRKNESSLKALKQTIRMKSGSDLLDFIAGDIDELKRILFDPESIGVITRAINASFWINEKMMEWLGEKNPADTLSQSVPNNVTSEMGLALLDVADAIRPYPEVVDYLHRAEDDNFLDGLVTLRGGKEACDAIEGYLNRYGMRCVGEIDIARTRWSEKPSTLLPLILSHVRNSPPGASKRKFEQGRQEALRKEVELLHRLRQLPDGAQKANEAKRRIDTIRNFSGYREYPKYAWVSRYLVYKQALLTEAEKLVQAGVIHESEDIFYLSFDELRELIRTYTLDYQTIRERKEAYIFYEKLTPPRVMTSDGEIISGKYRREDTPVGALPGLAVSSGVTEGRARVILKMEDAVLEEGDILVTSFTDPSWTPLFVSVKGLVTEVGGLMTHGAVIAREYGLPAVVGVENATKVIKDGQRIRVHGTEGYVEVL